jgi:hypothetical protein
MTGETQPFGAKKLLTDKAGWGEKLSITVMVMI